MYEDLTSPFCFSPSLPLFLSKQIFRDFLTSIHGGLHRTIEHLCIQVGVPYAKKADVQAGLLQPQPSLGTSFVIPGGWPVLKELMLSQCKIATGDLNGIEAPMLDKMVFASMVSDPPKLIPRNVYGDVKAAVEAMKKVKMEEWAECKVGESAGKLRSYNREGFVAWRKVRSAEI